MLDLGETVAQAAVREVAEETGIECAVTGLVGVYSDPGHVLRYTGDGEVRQEFSVLLAARALGGTPTPSSESPEVAWVSPAEARGRVTNPAMRRRLEHWLGRDAGPYLA
jgi:8-oxo-dGTP pyrophosphatase MutT (NUDIX family)